MLSTLRSPPLLTQRQRGRPARLTGGLADGRSVHHVLVDVIPVDVLPEPRLRRDVDEALVVHRVDQLVEPGRRHVVVDERVEQAALVVEAGADHRAERMQVAEAAGFYRQTVGPTHYWHILTEVWQWPKIGMPARAMSRT